MKKIDFKKIKEFLKRALITIAQRVFLTCVFLAVLALIIGGISFYKYSILAQEVKTLTFFYCNKKTVGGRGELNSRHSDHNRELCH